MSTRTVRPGRVTRKRKSRLPWLIWLAVIIAIVAWWALYQSRWFLVEHIRISGAHRVPVATVAQVAHINVGKPLMAVNPSAVIRDLTALPQVKAAKVERGWPHTVLITIVERAPIAAIAGKSGFRFVDNEGMLAGVGKTKPKTMWVVIGKPNTPAMKAAAQVIDGLPAKWKVGVAQATTPDSVIVTLGTGQQIVFGSSEQLSQKVKVAKALLVNRFKYINVSAPLNPTVK